MEKNFSEVAPNIVCFQEPLGVRFVSFYALAHGDSMTIFDAGIPQTVTYWINKGQLTQSIDRLVISHSDADHFGDAANLKQLFPDMKIMCHVQDKRWVEDHAAIVRERYGFSLERYGIGYPPKTLEALRGLCGDDFSVDGTLAEGESLEIGHRIWQVLHTPGHSPGHISLWSEADGILLVGDAVLGFGPPNFETGEPSIPSTHQDIEPYLKTIERLEALPIKLALAAHWQPMDGSEFTSLLSQSRENVERDLNFLREACRQKPHTYKDLLKGINEAFRTWDASDDMNYIYALDGAIQYLLAKGELTESDGTYHA